MTHNYKLGTRVKVLVNNPNYSGYDKGDIVTLVGFSSDVLPLHGGSFYKCNKDGSDSVLSVQEGYLEPVNVLTIALPTDGEQTQALLKELRMEEQMLRQLIMTMPFDQVKYLYLERRDLEFVKYVY